MLKSIVDCDSLLTLAGVSPEFIIYTQQRKSPPNFLAVSTSLYDMIYIRAFQISGLRLPRFSVGIPSNYHTDDPLMGRYTSARYFLWTGHEIASGYEIASGSESMS